MNNQKENIAIQKRIQELTSGPGVVLPPITGSLLGIAQSKTDFSDRELLVSSLKKKYTK